MAYWIKCTGTTRTPFDTDDWRPRLQSWRRERGEVSAFPRRPRVAGGDRLVNYAVGSARAFGSGRIFSAEEVVSEEPEARDHPRWPWVVEVRHVVSVPRLSLAPELREIGVMARSLSQHSHIRLTDEQGVLAEKGADRGRRAGAAPPAASWVIRGARKAALRLQSAWSRSRSSPVRSASA